MAISSFKLCLPPNAEYSGVDERVRGYFTFRVLSSSWVLPRSIPAQLEAQICFAGEGQQLSTPLPLSTGHEVHFPIVSPPAAFNRYIRDLQSLQIPVRNLTNGKEEPFASCVLTLGSLDLNKAQTVNLPVHTDNSRCLGHVEIALEARFNNNIPRQYVENEELSATKMESMVVQSVDLLDLHADSLLDDFETINSQADNTEKSEPQLSDLLPLVLAAIQRRKWHAATAFHQLDQNKSGKLDAEDSVRLIERTLPFQLSPAHHSYLRFMLDISGAKDFTLQQLTCSLKDCKDAAVMCLTASSRQVCSRLSNAAFDIQQRSLELGKMFRQRSDTENLHVQDIARSPVPRLQCVDLNISSSPQWHFLRHLMMQIAIVAMLVQNWDEQLQRILLTKIYQLLPEMIDQASLGDIKHVFRTIIMDQSQPWAHSNIKIYSESKHRAQTLDERRLTDGGDYVDGTSMPQVIAINSKDKFSPRKASYQTSSIAGCSTQQSLRLQTRPGQTIETEYNEICTLLAACRQASPGPRQQKRTGTSKCRSTEVQRGRSEHIISQQCPKNTLLESVPAEDDVCCRGQKQHSIHSDLSKLQTENCSGDMVDNLMSRAVQLRELLTGLASSVHHVCSTSSLSCSTAQRHAILTGTPAIQKAQDTAELAALKALTSSLQSVAGSATQADHRTDAGACSSEHWVVHEDSPHLEQRLSPGQQQPCDVGSMRPVSSSCKASTQFCRGDADVTALLSVSKLCDVVLSEAGKLLMTSAREPAFWLAWRMPGSVGVRPWLMVASLQNSSLRISRKDSACVHGPDTAAESEVFLTTSSLRAIRSLGQPMTMHCELWLLDGLDPNSAVMSGASALIGLLAVPMHMHVLLSGDIELAHGTYNVRNVVEGFTGAQLHICLTAPAGAASMLMNSFPSALLNGGPPVHTEACTTIMHSARIGNVTSNRDQIRPQDESMSTHYTVNHEFKVHILSVTQLPAQLQPADAHSPVARYLKYTFPCDDQALYTQDIPVQEAHQFEGATFALHRIGLPLGAPILKHLVHEDSLDDLDLVNLTFEVFDCFEEVTGMNDAVTFKGTLPVRNILEATKFNAPEWEEAVCMATSQSVPAFASQNRFDVALSDVRQSPSPVKILSTPTVSIDVQYTCELIVTQAM